VCELEHFSLRIVQSVNNVIELFLGVVEIYSFISQKAAPARTLVRQFAVLNCQSLMIDRDPQYRLRNLATPC
jgi:hypothetical protein